MNPFRLLVRLKVLLEVDGRFVLQRVQMLVTRASGPVSRFVSDFTSVSPPPPADSAFALWFCLKAEEAL